MNGRPAPPRRRSWDTQHMRDDIVPAFEKDIAELRVSLEAQGVPVKQAQRSRPSGVKAVAFCHLGQAEREPGS
jgi:hypothetical protein